MAALRSLAFRIAFIGGTIFYVIVSLIAALFGERAMLRWIHRWAYFHHLCVRYILGIRVRIEGEIPRGQFLFVAKHQSMFETIEVLLLLDMPLIVLKAELTRIPGWGWLASHYGGISVDRQGGASTMRAMLRESRRLLESGRSVIIFPEGTRVLPGETPPLRAGFAGLYRQFKLPVVPIALDVGRLWPRNRFVKRPGVVTFRFFDPIPPGVPRDEIEARVRREINALEFAAG